MSFPSPNQHVSKHWMEKYPIPRSLKFSPQTQLRSFIHPWVWPLKAACYRGGGGLPNCRVWRHCCHSWQRSSVIKVECFPLVGAPPPAAAWPWTRRCCQACSPLSDACPVLCVRWKCIIIWTLEVLGDRKPPPRVAIVIPHKSYSSSSCCGKNSFKNSYTQNSAV